MTALNLKIKRLHPDAQLPTYGSDAAAAFDLYAVNGAYLSPNSPTAVLDTGLAIEIPPGKAMLVYGRSGLAFKEDVRLANCVAVIDSDFRDSVKIKLTLDATHWAASHAVKAGDRIAQGMIVDAPIVTFTEVDELSDTARGAGGFGSTGT